MIKKGIFIALMLSVLFVACSHSEKQAASTTLGQSDNGLELPLPTIPKNITEPEARASYMIQHFWDTMNFADTVRSLNKDFVEQNFANFISLFPIAEQKNQKKAVNHLLKLAGSDKDAYALLIETARKYLYDPNSPMYDEDVYSLFVEGALAGSKLELSERERMTAERTWISMNRVGTTATDFTYRTPDGRTTTLLQTLIEGQLLLVLYDPTCDHCHDIIKSLADDMRLNERIAEGSLSVLAINLTPNVDKKEWVAADAIPSNWMKGDDMSNIQDDELYIIRATPSLYLLNAGHTVVAKDFPPNMLLSSN